MGYVPPHHNIVAVHYGSRMRVRQASIKRKERVQKIELPDLLEQYKKERECKSSDLYKKWKLVEGQITQKGLLFDKQV
ncbi:hypothetical protein [Alkalihalobacterium elongatum]|uniref:hypothetical protein n=1 Tax=Alkalihalobacterium elongatum TaxID=2675466 RepID=UPI001C1F46C1|nr:hypothetical protein [Alkalihalobacterium elongatum]